MAFEALNYIGQAQMPLVIILNDNVMSISRNVGALMKHLGNMRAATQYRQTRDRCRKSWKPVALSARRSPISGAT